MKRSLKKFMGSNVTTEKLRKMLLHLVLGERIFGKRRVI